MLFISQDIYASRGIAAESSHSTFLAPRSRPRRRCYTVNAGVQEREE